MLYDYPRCISCIIVDILSEILLFFLVLSDIKALTKLHFQCLQHVMQSNVICSERLQTAKQKTPCQTATHTTARTRLVQSAKSNTTMRSHISTNYQSSY